MERLYILVALVSSAVIMAVAASAGLVEIGHLQGFYQCVMVDGTYAYCAGPTFDVVNIENPSNPWVEGSLENIDGSDIFVHGNFAYIASSTLRIIDISIPASPASVGNLENIGAWEVYVHDGYAQLTGGTGGTFFMVIDVHDPCNPALVGTLKSWTTAMDVHGVYGTTPYVFSTRGYWGGGDFGVIDISNPTDPSLVGSLFIFPPPRGIDCADGYAYVAASSGGDDGLVVIDISDPTEPNEIARCRASYALKVAVHGGYAYLSRCHGFTVIDIHDPAHPFQVETIYSPYPDGVYADHNNYAYLADWEHGLSIFRYVESPSVIISLIPETTTVTWGDTLAYEATLTNLTDEEQAFRFGSLIRCPNGADHVLIKPNRVSLPPQGAKTVRIEHVVPPKTVVGEYVYIAKIGISPIDLWDEGRFVFEVVEE
jgi:hypothetical protein